MATPRQTLAAKLAEDNPSCKVLPYPFTPSNVEAGKPVISVWRGELNPGTARFTLTHSLQINAYGSRTKGAEAEDEMDDLLDGVLLTVARLEGWKFTNCKRATFNEGALSGWEITLTAESANVYRETVQKEVENG